MKLRPIPIVLTVVISAALLFGGWFLYRQTTMQGPLQNIAKDYKGVNNAQFDINHNQINVKLDLKPDTNVSGLVNDITTEGKSVVGNRTLNFEFVDHSSDKLNHFWDTAMFSVAEAMDHKKYTDIPVKLQELAKDTGIKVQTEMDSKNVYISLSDGSASKYIVLPRDPGKVGVWE
ncbi:hypothetical protein MUG84_04700 [Paenibacillus sp. KQZ6P-2]|uniref:Uncharacterized protein n=1 Tax=Paenibacillus mangrovi TaxID=2931978 RepID=A0A9X2B3Y1_9BACL|nr:hypothetical protein [Paenibacillus mangrovi]MCJ8011042.1 hypothetical protein [Paenibacillus mangrovi]